MLLPASIWVGRDLLPWWSDECCELWRSSVHNFLLLPLPSALNAPLPCTMSGNQCIFLTVSFLSDNFNAQMCENSSGHDAHEHEHERNEGKDLKNSTQHAATFSLLLPQLYLWVVISRQENWMLQLNFPTVFHSFSSCPFLAVKCLKLWGKSACGRFKPQCRQKHLPNELWTKIKLYTILYVYLVHPHVHMWMRMWYVYQ